MAMLSQSNDEMRMNALMLIVVSRVICSSINRFAGWVRGRGIELEEIREERRKGEGCVVSPDLTMRTLMSSGLTLVGWYHTSISFLCPKPPYNSQEKPS
jgi:hypothetical protein